MSEKLSDISCRSGVEIFLVALYRLTNGNLQPTLLQASPLFGFMDEICETFFQPWSLTPSPVVRCKIR